MILNDKDIKSRVIDESLITPTPSANQLQPCSVDLNLGNEFLVCDTLFNVVDTKNCTDDMYTLYNERESFVIMPEDFVLATTVEEVKIPYDMCAVVDGKSTFGRFGITVHATAGFIDAGFEGNITLEISNVSPNPIKLYVGEPICQIVYYELTDKCSKPYGSCNNHYQNQKGATVPKI